MRTKKILSFILTLAALIISGCASTQPQQNNTAPRIYIDQGPLINANYPEYYNAYTPAPVPAQPQPQQKKAVNYTPHLRLGTGINFGKGGVNFSGIGLGTGVSIW